MLQQYKEVFFGLLFGIGAGLIDVDMHARMEQGSFWSQLVRPQPAMIVYRVIFLLFGAALGWLLWQKNKRERDFRSLQETLERFHRTVSGPVLLMHAELQLLLMKKEEFHLSPQAETAVQSVFKKSAEVQTIARETLPPPGSSSLSAAAGV